MNDLAAIQPGIYTDPDSGEIISVAVSSRYSKITIGKRDWFFIRETGAFDGTSISLVERGPILAWDANRGWGKELPTSDHPIAGREE